MSSDNVGHLITKTITTLQHFATLQHTSPNYTSLHLSTLHSLSFTLHYSLIWLNPIVSDTLLLRPSLYCKTSPHFTQLHFTILTDTSLPLIYTSLLSHFV